MATRKISELSSIASSNISPQSAVLPIVNGGETFKVTVNDLIDSAEVIDLGGNGHLIAQSGSFQYITASLIDVDAKTIRIGGVPFSRANVNNLKEGKSIATDTNNMLVSPKDATTKIRTSTTGRMAFYAGNNAAIDVKSDKVAMDRDWETYC